MVAGNGSAKGTPRSDVIPRAMPVPAPPPGVTDVLRRTAQIGLGAIGLASRAAGGMFARVPDPSSDRTDPDPGIVALLPGALLGVAIEAEKRAAAVVDTLAAHSTGVVRVASKPAIIQRALRPLEDRLWHLNEVARREQHRNQAQASALIPVIVQQVTENVIAQLDFVRIVEQIPLDDIAGAIDIEAIVQRIDLGGVIRESTMSLTMETVDAIRSEAIDIDGWAARVVDKVLRRKGARDVTIEEAS